MEVRNIKIKDLVYNVGQVEGLPKNPRTISEEKLNALKKSLEDDPEFLKAREILVYDSGEELVVFCGNQRLRAATELGMKEVPCKVYPKETTPEKLRAYTIKDNIAYGENDWEALNDEGWDNEELEEWGMDLPEQKDITIGEAEEDNYEIPEELEVNIVLGDLIEIGEHRLLCGSSLETESWDRVLNGEKIDLVVTDPPYNVDYTGGTKDKLKIENDNMSNDDFYQFLLDYYTTQFIYCKEGAPIYVWHADSEGANFRKAMTNGGFALKQCLIWIKNSLVMGRQDYQWKHEPCLYGWKEGAAHKWYSDRKQTTTLEFDRPSKNTEHPTMKPIALIAYQVNNSSKKGDIVADGFLGSGTTMVAAHQLNRKCYGMELDPKYCQVIIDRMKKLDPTLTIKINGKEEEV